MARSIALWLSLVGVASAGCDSASEDAARRALPDGPPKERIAVSVNGFFDAWNAGDGELACTYLTERGRSLVLRIVRQAEELEDVGQPESCEDAIEASAEATDERIGQVAVADRVRIDSPRRAAVMSEFRGELSLRKVDGEWLIDVPAFLD